MRKFMAGLVALAATAAAADAAPITFNFEAVATGNYASLPMTASGLTATVTRTGGLQFTIGSYGGVPASWGSRSMENFSFLTGGTGNPYNVNFSGAGVSSVSLQFGDFGPSDDDTPVTMQAWSGLNGTGTLLGTDTESWLGSDSFPGFGTLSLLSGTPIRSITFTAGGTFPNSLFWDNLVVEPAAVPEPLSVLVFGGLLAAGGLAVRRRVTATA